MFASARPPALVAQALQWVLSSVTLTREQWEIVAAGGKQLENSAIVWIAQRATGTS